MRSSTRRGHAARRFGGPLIALALVAAALPSGVRGGRWQGLIAALETDEEVTAKPSTPTRQQLVSPVVRWYQVANHGGAFFDAYDLHPDLSVIGWPGQISSFKTVSGRHPVWWQGRRLHGFHVGLRDR